MKAVLFFCFLLMELNGFTQIDTTTPPFKKYPTLPPLQLILADSTTKYTKADLPKNKPVVLMLFSPDCEHCRHEAEQIAAHQEEVKDIHFVLVTTFPLYRIKAFVEAHGLAGMKNVVVAKDPYYLLLPFYDVRSLPFFALYNKKGKLVEAREGTLTIDRILSLL